MPYSDTLSVPAPTDFSALLILQGSTPPGPYYGEPGSGDAVDLTQSAGLARQQATAAAAAAATVAPAPVSTPTPTEPPPISPPTPTEPPPISPPSTTPPPPAAEPAVTVETPTFDMNPGTGPLDSNLGRFPPPQGPSVEPIFEGEVLQPAVDVGGSAFGDVLGGILRGIFGPVGAGIGAIVIPGQLGSGELPFPPIKGVRIPEPKPPVFVIPDAPIPYTPPELGRPTPPDVVVVEAPAPEPPAMPQPGTPASVSATPWWLGPAIIAGTVLAPRLTPRRRGVPKPIQFAPPAPSVAPAPAPAPAPYTPGETFRWPTPTPAPAPSPVPIPTPTPAPTALATAGPAGPLTPLKTPPVESAPQCETPQERKDRQQRKRDACKKLISIKVRAHYRKVCVSEAIHHEVGKAKRKIIRKYITRPAGQLGKRAVERGLEYLGLPPATKDVAKRVRELTRKERPITIPGTDIRINPEALLRRTKA